MPIRTCVGCGSKADSTELVRIVAEGGRAVIDIRRCLPGRGAHLHPKTACLDAALRRRAFARALRSSVCVEGLVMPEDANS